MGNAPLHEGRERGVLAHGGELILRRRDRGDGLAEIDIEMHGAAGALVTVNDNIDGLLARDAIEINLRLGLDGAV